MGGGKSILHAAIHLVDDENLVKRMLKLGADPRSSSRTEIGTPLNLAQNFFHTATEKEKNMTLIMDRTKDIEAKNKLSSDVEAQRKRCDQAKTLVEILQQHIIEPLPASASAIPPKMSDTHNSVQDKSASDTSAPPAAFKQAHELMATTLSSLENPGRGSDTQEGANW